MFEVNEGIIQVSYIIATILFILALGGLSNQETARRGNTYGLVGMIIAIAATILLLLVPDAYGTVREIGRNNWAVLIATRRRNPPVDFTASDPSDAKCETGLLTGFS